MHLPRVKQEKGFAMGTASKGTNRRSPAELLIGTLLAALTALLLAGCGGDDGAAPATPAVPTAALDTAKAVTASIGRAGGTVTATASDGTTYLQGLGPVLPAASAAPWGSQLEAFAGVTTFSENTMKLKVFAATVLAASSVSAFAVGPGPMGPIDNMPISCTGVAAQCGVCHSRRHSHPEGA
jgi:hypothetical protein